MFAACLDVTAQDAVTTSYKQTHLVSDVPGLALATEPLLVNPWGLSRPLRGMERDSNWWAADQRTRVSTLYSADGSFLPLVVTIPSASSAAKGGPAGTTFFEKNFVFATLDGTVSQWFAGVLPSQPG